MCFNMKQRCVRSIWWRFLYFQHGSQTNTYANHQRQLLICLLCTMLIRGDVRFAPIEVCMCVNVCAAATQFTCASDSVTFQLRAANHSLCSVHSIYNSQSLCIDSLTSEVHKTRSKRKAKEKTNHSKCRNAKHWTIKSRIPPKKR